MIFKLFLDTTCRELTQCIAYGDQIRAIGINEQLEVKNTPRLNKSAINKKREKYYATYYSSSQKSTERLKLLNQ